MVVIFVLLFTTKLSVISLTLAKITFSELSAPLKNILFTVVRALAPSKAVFLKSKPALIIAFFLAAAVPCGGSFHRSRPSPGARCGRRSHTCSRSRPAARELSCSAPRGTFQNPRRRGSCRRAERHSLMIGTGGEANTEVSEQLAVGQRYLNRLSDYLFTLARFLCIENDEKEVFWLP